MTNRLRALAIGLALTAALAPALGAPAPACASETGPHAALVVDTGSTVDMVCVALDGPSVSGLHLIELAAKQQGVTYAFGFGGQAVCRIDGTGPAGGDCFADYPDFWGYWRGDGHGGWSWSSTGPADTSVGDGDIEGWVWGTGDTGSSHARPPATTTDEVCAAPAPSPPGLPTATAKAAPLTSSRPSATGVTTTPASAIRNPTSPTRTRTRSGEVAVRAVAADPPAGGGPPAGLLAALGIGLALGAGGWLRLRSSRREGR